MKRQFFLIVLLSYVFAFSFAGELTLQKDGFRITIPQNADPQVLLAAQTLAKDINKVMGFTPKIGPITGSGIQLCIVQGDKEGADDLLTQQRELDGWESHRVFADTDNNRIYLHGYDMRGTIYAIYTFAEKVLGVPPLWYWCSWEPEVKESITLTDELDLYFSSPTVRYRAWFPNDTDLFTPWVNKSTEHKEAWLETMLRLKLNTVELEGCVRWDKKGLNDDAMRLQRFGLVLTSHHHAPLACGFVMWDDYWKNVRGMSSVPRLTLNDKEKIYEFWQYSIDCIMAANIEYIWLIGFRGSGDHAFWESGDEGRKVEDAPSGEAERAQVINEMTQKMYDMICASTGDPDPFVRMTFYNELSDLMGKGLLTPPSNSNMLWTYVAARRDHYPSVDLRNHKNPNVNVGLYFNFQFTSTGSHLAPAEGPWKMEYNFRYALTKAPLQFSVVNMGNLREYMMEASANAAFLWDYNRYTTDNFLMQYAKQYFGPDHAAEIAQLYHDYYYSYWNQHESDFQSMPRQYVFQDLRYKEAYASIRSNFGNGKINIFDDGKLNIGNHQNELNDLMTGMSNSAKGFTNVLDRAEELRPQLEPRYQQFFYDNFVQYARFMAGLSTSLWHFGYASLNENKDRAGHGAIAIGIYTNAARALYHAQHGEFSSWIDDVSGNKFGLGYVHGRMTGVLSVDDCELTAPVPDASPSGNTTHFEYTQSAASISDILFVYPASAIDRWFNIKIGDKVVRKFAPRAGAVKSISDTRGYLVVSTYLPKGTTTIDITTDSGNAPTITGMHVTQSAYTSTKAPTFDAITPDDDWDVETPGMNGIFKPQISNHKSQTIYNLQGQHVNAIGKGLYIVNGKKIIK